MGRFVKMGVWCSCGMFGEAEWLGRRCVGKETMMLVTSSLSAWAERRRDDPSFGPRAAHIPLCLRTLRDALLVRMKVPLGGGCVTR